MTIPKKRLKYEGVTPHDEYTFADVLREVHSS
jgi:hypothetical protein